MSGPGLLFRYIAVHLLCPQYSGRHHLTAKIVYTNSRQYQSVLALLLSVRLLNFKIGAVQNKTNRVRLFVTQRRRIR